MVKQDNAGGISLFQTASSKRLGAGKFALRALRSPAKPPVKRVKVVVNRQSSSNESRVSDITGSIGEEEMFMRSGPMIIKEVRVEDIDVESSVMGMSVMSKNNDSSNASSFSITKAYTSAKNIPMSTSVGKAVKTTPQPSAFSPSIRKDFKPMQKKSMEIQNGIRISAPSPMSLDRVQVQMGQEHVAPESKEYKDNMAVVRKKQEKVIQKETLVRAKQAAKEQLKRDAELELGQGFEAELGEFTPEVALRKKKSLVKKILGKIKPKSPRKKGAQQQQGQQPPNENTAPLTAVEARSLARKALDASKQKKNKNVLQTATSPLAALQTNNGLAKFPVSEILMEKKDDSISDLDASARRPHFPVSEINTNRKLLGGDENEARDEESVSTLGTPHAFESFDGPLATKNGERRDPTPVSEMEAKFGGIVCHQASQGTGIQQIDPPVVCPDKRGGVDDIPPVGSFDASRVRHRNGNALFDDSVSGADHTTTFTEEVMLPGGDPVVNLGLAALCLGPAVLAQRKAIANNNGSKKSPDNIESKYKALDEDIESRLKQMAQVHERKEVSLFETFQDPPDQGKAVPNVPLSPTSAFNHALDAAIRQVETQMRVPHTIETNPDTNPDPTPDLTDGSGTSSVKQLDEEETTVESEEIHADQSEPFEGALDLHKTLSPIDEDDNEVVSPAASPLTEALETTSNRQFKPSTEGSASGKDQENLSGQGSRQSEHSESRGESNEESDNQSIPELEEVDTQRERTHQNNAGGIIDLTYYDSPMTYYDSPKGTENSAIWVESPVTSPYNKSSQTHNKSPQRSLHATTSETKANNEEEKSAKGTFSFDDLMDIAASKLGLSSGRLKADDDDRYAIEGDESPESPKQVIVGRRVEKTPSDDSVPVVQGVEIKSKEMNSKVAVNLKASGGAKPLFGSLDSGSTNDEKDGEKAEAKASSTNSSFEQYDDPDGDVAVCYDHNPTTKPVVQGVQIESKKMHSKVAVTPKASGGAKPLFGSLDSESTNDEKNGEKAEAKASSTNSSFEQYDDPDANVVVCYDQNPTTQDSGESFEENIETKLPSPQGPKSPTEQSACASNGFAGYFSDGLFDLLSMDESVKGQRKTSRRSGSVQPSGRTKRSHKSVDSRTNGDDSDALDYVFEYSEDVICGKRTEQATMKEKFPALLASQATPALLASQTAVTEIQANGVEKNQALKDFHKETGAGVVLADESDESDENDGSTDDGSTQADASAFDNGLDPSMGMMCGAVPLYFMYSMKNALDGKRTGTKRNTPSSRKQKSRERARESATVREVQLSYPTKTDAEEPLSIGTCESSIEKEIEVAEDRKFREGTEIIGTCGSSIEKEIEVAKDRKFHEGTEIIGTCESSIEKEIEVAEDRKFHEVTEMDQQEPPIMDKEDPPTKDRDGAVALLKTKADQVEVIDLTSSPRYGSQPFKRQKEPPTPERAGHDDARSTGSLRHKDASSLSSSRSRKQAPPTPERRGRRGNRILLDKDDVYWDTLSTIASTKDRSSDNDKFALPISSNPGPIPIEITMTSKDLGNEEEAVEAKAVASMCVPKKAAAEAAKVSQSIGKLNSLIREDQIDPSLSFALAAEASKHTKTKHGRKSGKSLLEGPLRVTRGGSISGDESLLGPPSHSSEIIAADTAARSSDSVSRSSRVAGLIARFEAARGEGDELKASSAQSVTNASKKSEFSEDNSALLLAVTRSEGSEHAPFDLKDLEDAKEAVEAIEPDLKDLEDAKEAVEAVEPEGVGPGGYRSSGSNDSPADLREYQSSNDSPSEALDANVRVEQPTIYADEATHIYAEEEIEVRHFASQSPPPTPEITMEPTARKNGVQSISDKQGIYADSSDEESEDPAGSFFNTSAQHETSTHWQTSESGTTSSNSRNSTATWNMPQRDQDTPIAVSTIMATSFANSWKNYSNAHRSVSWGFEEIYEAPDRSESPPCLPEVKGLAERQISVNSEVPLSSNGSQMSVAGGSKACYKGDHNVGSGSNVDRAVLSAIAAAAAGAAVSNNWPGSTAASQQPYATGSESTDSLGLGIGDDQEAPSPQNLTYNDEQELISRTLKLSKDLLASMSAQDLEEADDEVVRSLMSFGTESDSAGLSLPAVQSSPAVGSAIDERSQAKISTTSSAANGESDIDTTEGEVVEGEDKDTSQEAIEVINLEDENSGSNQPTPISEYEYGSEVPVSVSFNALNSAIAGNMQPISVIPHERSDTVQPISVCLHEPSYTESSPGRDKEAYSTRTYSSFGADTEESAPPTVSEISHGSPANVERLFSKYDTLAHHLIGQNDKLKRAAQHGDDSHFESGTARHHTPAIVDKLDALRSQRAEALARFNHSRVPKTSTDLEANPSDGARLSRGTFVSESAGASTYDRRERDRLQYYSNAESSRTHYARPEVNSDRSRSISYARSEVNSDRSRSISVGKTRPGIRHWPFYDSRRARSAERVRAYSNPIEAREDESVSTSSSSVKTTPSGKARELRRQLDDALQASRKIRESQQQLGSELQTFKNRFFRRNDELENQAKRVINGTRWAGEAVVQEDKVEE